MTNETSSITAMDDNSISQTESAGEGKRELINTN